MFRYELTVIDVFYNFIEHINTELLTEKDVNQLFDSFTYSSVPYLAQARS